MQHLQNRITRIESILIDYDAMLSKMEAENKTDSEIYQLIIDMKFNDLVRLRGLKSKMN